MLLDVWILPPAQYGVKTLGPKSVTITALAEPNSVSDGFIFVWREDVTMPSPSLFMSQFLL